MYKSILILLILNIPLFAKTVEYKLHITEETIVVADKKVKALMVNKSIPAPTLRFTVGDTAKITLVNGLKNEDTSLHWHGIVLPLAMDGVPYLTTPRIKPGESFTYEFELKHSGTYWYHSHTGLQEQLGLYGAIVVDNPAEKIKVSQDHVLVLSDWTNEKPTNVMKTLMRGDDWYAIKKNNEQTLLGAIQANAFGEFLGNQWSKIPPMDISDVAYEQFWINGKQKINLTAKGGEKVRLRLINAGAATYFYLTAGAPMQVIAADGLNVEPFTLKQLFLGNGETYDILITMPEKNSVELVASAQDGSGEAVAILGEGELLKSENRPPKPNIYQMENMLLHALDKEAAAQQGRAAAPYEFLKSPEKNSIDNNLPRRKISLRLTGDMKKYIWSFNGKTLYQESVIKVRKNEVLQIELINDTMMHHPLHLHGHFFKLLNGQGDFSPLKHTVDLPPMGKQTIEFVTDNVGDWFFHCHLLYHMDAGMARVFSYEEMGENHQISIDPAMINPWYFMVDGMLLTNMSMGHANIMQNREDFYLDWETSYKDHKKYEFNLGWNHYYNPDWSSFIEVEKTFEQTHEMDHSKKWEKETRLFVGAEYTLPLFANLKLGIDHNGELRTSIHKDFSLAKKLTLHSELQYDTLDEWEWKLSLEYRLTQQISLALLYHSEHDYGVGISFSF